MEIVLIKIVVVVFAVLKFVGWKSISNLAEASREFSEAGSEEALKQAREWRIRQNKKVK